MFKVARITFLCCVLHLALPAQVQKAAIPQQERDALIALFHGADGARWKNAEGWLGPRGSECEWYGVQCLPIGDSQHVISLELSDNNLQGMIPETLSELSELQWLSFAQNHLSNQLPVPLIERWLSGRLWIAAEASLLTTISEIDFEWSAPSLLCAQHRLVLRSDGTAISYAKRCRNSSANDRRTFCEIKKGMDYHEFAKLAWLLQKNNFEKLDRKYDRNMTHGTFQKLRVRRGNTTIEIEDYAESGPFSLWEVERSIDGVGSRIDWTSTQTQDGCPGW